jgi:hypothetical protein
MYYRLAGKDAPRQVLAALEWIIGWLGDSSQLIQDERRLKKILEIDPEILCSRSPRSEI